MRSVAILWLEVISLAESHILIIFLVIPSFTQPFPRPLPLLFNLFADDDDALIIAAKSGYDLELKDFGMDYQ